MELLLLVFFCLLTGSEVTFGDGTKVIRVKEGRDITLPCSLREDITNKKFEWKKDGRQVFLYDDGDHSNFVPTGQDQQFVQRVSHFPDELKSGDASITISNMKMADTGNYICEFPDLQPRQIFHIVLVVERDIPGAVNAEAKPYVRILNQTDFNAVLQCEVRGVFPKPELHWEDGDRNKFPADEPQETVREGRYDIILNTTVTKTSNYRCVATYGEANWTTHAKTYVHIHVAVPKLSIRTQQFWCSAVLQCEIRGVFPKPEFHWQDGAGNKLEAEEPQVTDKEGHYAIILQTTVTKTDNYRCVVTQKENNQQAHAYIYVDIHGFPYGRVVTVVVLVLVVVLLVYRWRYRFMSCCRKGAPQLSVRILNQTQRAAVLQCKVRGVFPKPELDWEDSDGNKLPADETLVSKIGCFYNIILQTTVTETGYYTCVAEQEEPKPQTHAKTYVHIPGPKVITVDEGEDAILPCSLREDITNKKFVWKKDGRQVFPYDDEDHSNTGQDQQFIRRVSHDPDKLKSGDASITISNTRVTDSGEYTCEFPDLHPSQTFRIKLVVYGSAVDEEQSPV